MIRDATAGDADAIAGIALPSPGSVALHDKLGYPQGGRLAPYPPGRTGHRIRP